MADNKTTTTTVATVPSGVIIATDEIGGVDYQRVKVVWGADGTATDTSAAAPLPVVQASVVPGTAATNLGKAEDAAHTTGDTGVMMLAVRRDANTTLAGTDGDYAPPQVDASGSLKVAIISGAGTGGTSATDDAAFTVGSGSGTPIMALADQTSPDSVDEGDVGVVRMSLARGLHVVLHDSAGTEIGLGGLLRIAVNAAGLTTATTAYVTGDVLGSELSFASAGRTTGGTGVIESAILIDKSDILGATDLYLFRAASSPAADNAANSWADTNTEDLVGVINFAPVDSALNRHATWSGAIPYECAATTLFGVLVTRTGHTFFGAATDLRVTLFVRRD